MRIGVCGVACEKCPKMVKGICPNGERGCEPRKTKFCNIPSCAFEKGVRLCFECSEFPCETSKLGPINHGFCQYISGSEA
ncbi:MAG: DUF3795 domain-containing protein [Candidatus Bathyarchaeota archaeon]|nr:MAG: DUF3795 domain-containing protein [Candidatus Bathyarchaeota archaeon]